MSPESRSSATADLVLLVQRDGRIARHLGGRGPQGITTAALEGRGIEELVEGADAASLRQWLRKALATRGAVEGTIEAGGRHYEVRFSAEGPNRAVCVLRECAADEDDERESARAPAAGASDRRGFIHRFQQSVADAALREQSLAVGLVFLDGVADIGAMIDYTISEKVVTAALQRLPQPQKDELPPGADWYVGQLGESLLAVVIEGMPERDSVHDVATRLAASLAEPVTIGTAQFTLRPSTGVAMLGQDAGRPQALLECARAAMMEARRAASPVVHFYSDTLHLRPMVRLDIERELRLAIADDELQLHYLGRHELEGGQLRALQAYLRWPTRLRGEIPPAQFLPIAENTGLALQLSQWALGRLAREWAALRAAAGDGVRISFGALRHHLVGDGLAQDLESLAKAGSIDPAALEIRLAETTLAALPDPARTLGRLHGLGARIVVDELGRGASALQRLAELPIHALQVDRRFVARLDADPAASSVCRGVAGLAQGCGCLAFAPGVDSDRLRSRLAQAGFGQGLGDHFGSLPALGIAGSKLRLTG